MGIRVICEGSLSVTFVLSEQGVDVAEVDVLHHPDDGRRYISYRPLIQGKGHHSVGEVAREDPRDDEQLAKDVNFLSGRFTNPAFRRKVL